MLLKNERVLAQIAENTGALVRLQDRASGMEFISALPETACRVVAKHHRTERGCEFVTAEKVFTAHEAVSAPIENGISLQWELEQGITVFAQVSLLPDGLSFTSHAECCDRTQLMLVEYPVIGGMGGFDDKAEMIHSFATGMRVKNPLKNFKSGDGVRFAPYPECFSGSSMQFYAYYAQGKGGLLFTAEDGESHQKWLNLYRNGDAMEGTLMYGYENLGFGKPLFAPYAFTVRFLKGDGWWEPAQKYKEWATKQAWCEMGTLKQRRHCEWLQKDIGLTTFGIDASRDRSEYIRRYHEDVNTRVFHVLGPDWAHTTQSFSKGNPGYSLDGWVPTDFNQPTLHEIARVGDYFAPFEFDMFGHPTERDNEETRKAADLNRQLFPKRPYTYSCDAYDFYMMCPCQEHTHDLHVERDAQVVRESGAQAMYYDISANNLVHVCLSDQHNHPPGGGNVLTKSYRKIYRDTKDACAEALKADYFPVGTEMINEVFLPELDFYQARAGAQPGSALEMWPYKSLIDQGKAELIPLFAYVYHEYGAVRMDGWGKVVEETGDLFYDSVAKIYEWGGLYEINHEYSPGEAFNGVETSVEDHYWEHFGPFGYEYSLGRARYIRQFADLRTGRGNRYLSYGRMMPEPRIEIAQRSKHYYHYNHGVKEIFSGDISLPAVRIAAWKSMDEDKTGYALFFTNTELDCQQVTVSLQKSDYPSAEKATLVSGFGRDAIHEQAMGVLPQDGALTLTLSLPSRAPVMLEIL